MPAVKPAKKIAAKRKAPVKKKTAARKTPVRKKTSVKRKPAVKKPTGAAPRGNKFWMNRLSHGRKPKFKTPNELWLLCCEYFQWVEDNPLQEEKLFSYQGEIVKGTANKMRAMTLDGLYLFIGITRPTWYEYREKNGFSTITTQVEMIIRDYKFSGAAADLLNANIIARDLGLVDKKETDVGNKDGEAFRVASEIDLNVDPKEAQRQFMIAAKAGKL